MLVDGLTGRLSELPMVSAGEDTEPIRWALDSGTSSLFSDLVNSVSAVLAKVALLSNRLWAAVIDAK